MSKESTDYSQEQTPSNREQLIYNTERDALVFREYGRNVQNLVRHLKTIEDEDERTRAAETLINLMKQLNPSVRENSDNIHRIWDHLYIMADGEIKFNNEFEPQTEEERSRRPEHIGYTDRPVKYRHYGRNVELLIEKAMEIEDEEELLEAVSDIGKLMKTFYLTWNRDNVEDETILRDIKRLSGGKIDFDLEDIKEDGLFELDSKTKKRSRNARQQHNNSNNRKRNSRNNNNNRGGYKKNRRRGKGRR